MPFRHGSILTEAEKIVIWKKVMTKKVISLAHETYAQDIVSLGYGWLNGSCMPSDSERLAPRSDLEQDPSNP